MHARKQCFLDMNWTNCLDLDGSSQKYEGFITSIEVIECSCILEAEKGTILLDFLGKNNKDCC